MKYYVHHTPGRLRIRIPSIRSNPYRADKVKALLNVNGVERIEVNSLTGSVVVAYDMDAVSAQGLLGILKEGGFYSEDQTISIDMHIQQATGKAAHKVGKAMFGWAVGKVLEANGLSLIAAII